MEAEKCVFVCLMKKQTEIAQSSRHTIILSTNIPCGSSVLRYQLMKLIQGYQIKKKKKPQFYL